jgi:hypothetical protein
MAGIIVIKGHGRFLFWLAITAFLPHYQSRRLLNWRGPINATAFALSAAGAVGNLGVVTMRDRAYQLFNGRKRYGRHRVQGVRGTCAAEA